MLANGGDRLTLSSSNASAVFSSATSIYTSNGGNISQNLFETIGNLVAFMETNNQQGISQALDGIKLCQTQITTALASVGVARTGFPPPRPSWATSRTASPRS